MSLDILLAVYAVLTGLIVGSYLNVVIHRLPRGASTVLPRSRCPACGAPIRARDNLPLLSFLLLGGRCRSCGIRIAWRYPLVELASALLFLGAMLRWGLTAQALVAVLFGCAMLALAAIDVEHYVLPDRITLPGTLLGLALQPWNPAVSLQSALTAAAAGGVFLLAVSWLWFLLRHEEGMGLGDVKMLAMIGAFLGLAGLAVTLFFAFFTGAVAGLVLIAVKGGGMKTRLPFGAFLGLAALFALFWGRPLADLYLSLL